MRNLNLDELGDKIHEYALDLEYINRQHLRVKLNQFINFLNSQPISQRILQRIEEDYIELKNSIPQEGALHLSTLKSEFLKKIKTPDQQGAFGCFLIIQTFNTNRIQDNLYLEATSQWFSVRGDYDHWREVFNSFVFKPFIELLNWYISESRSYNSKDYFSKIEITEFSEKLDTLLKDIRLGQEVLYEEIQDLKEQMKNMKKKNWGELLKGKLIDMVLGKVISIESFNEIVKYITGQDFKLLQ